jgi:hypothetical protein
MACYIFLKSLRSLEEFRKNPHVKIPPKSPSTNFQSLGKFKNPILIQKFLFFLIFGPADPAARDEDIDDIRTTTPAAQVAPSPTEAALPQVVHPQDAPLQAAPPPSVVTTTPDVISYQGPITRARARELNFVTMLKNDGPEE